MFSRSTGRFEVEDLASDTDTWDSTSSHPENPNGIPSLSPGLPRRRGYPGFTTKKIPNPERVASIPHIRLFERHLVALQQTAELVLKGEFGVVVLLFGDVSADFIDLRVLERD